MSADAIPTASPGKEKLLHRQSQKPEEWRLFEVRTDAVEVDADAGRRRRTSVPT
jgi:hypothetical protein